MRSIGLALLVGATCTFLPAIEASAAPVNSALVVTNSDQQSDFMLVRDGCGRGRHYSRYRGACVWNGQRGYGYGYVQPYYGYGYYNRPYYGGYGFYGAPYRGYYRGWW